MSGDKAPEGKAAQILARLDVLDKVMERLDTLDRTVTALQERLEQGNLQAAGRDRILLARLVAARHDLGEALQLLQTPREAAPPPAELRLPLTASMAEVEREVILQVLQAEQGHRSRTAERLGISRRKVQMVLGEALAEGVQVPEAPNKPRRLPGDDGQ